MSTVDTELRELDAEIAEKVMGWRWYRRHDPKEEMFYCVAPDVKVQRNVGEGIFGEKLHKLGGMVFYTKVTKSQKPTSQAHCDYDTVPYYSSELEAAMSVVDHLIAKGHGLDMQAWIPEQRNQGIWRVDFESSDEGDTVTHGFVYSDSLPEAICRAALKTVKVDE